MQSKNLSDKLSKLSVKVDFAVHKTNLSVYCNYAWIFLGQWLLALTLYCLHKNYMIKLQNSYLAHQIQQPIPKIQFGFSQLFLPTSSDANTN